LASRTAVERHRGRIGPVPFGRHLARQQPERPGRDDERPIGVRERLAERRDGPAIRFGGVLEAPGERDVVLERQVDYAVRRGGGVPQAVQVVQVAAAYPRPGRGERGGRGLRAGEPGDLVAGADEFGHDGGADPAGRAGDEDMHENPSRYG
jgi:hypothetical protein